MSETTIITKLKNHDEIPYIAGRNGWYDYEGYQKELFIKGYRVCWSTPHGIFFPNSWDYIFNHSPIKGNGATKERAAEFCAKYMDKFIAYVTNPANLKEGCSICLSQFLEKYPFVHKEEFGHDPFVYWAEGEDCLWDLHHLSDYSVSSCESGVYYMVKK